MQLKRRNIFCYVFSTTGIVFTISLVLTFDYATRSRVTLNGSEEIYYKIDTETNSAHRNRRFILKPAQDYCQHIDFLLVIHTEHNDLQMRDFFRATYGVSNLIKSFRYKLLFPVGMSLDPRERIKRLQDLLEEHRYHGDILLGGYLDTYRNISYKQQTHLRFFSEYCKNTVLVKIDDDVGLRIDKVASLVRDMKEDPNSHKILCRVWKHMPIVRNIISKWYVPPTVYSGKEFPEYCSGMAYLSTYEAAKRIVDVIDEIPFFWVDDVYITGLLATRGNVQRVDISQMYALHYDNGTGLELGKIIFQMAPREKGMEMFKKSIKGMRQKRLHPITYYCDTPFCKL